MIVMKTQALLDRFSEGADLLLHRARGLAHRSIDGRPEQVEQAVELGAGFVRHHQRADGSFRDFLLEPGASTTWVTAHLAFVLENVPRLDDVCERAAAYLCSTGARDRGWGYNRRVGRDCDSTAQALLALRRFGHRIPGDVVEWLLRAQTPAGGFPTYVPARTPQSGWEMPQPDVTLLVREALGRLGGHDEAHDRATRWLEGQAHEGVVPSYWWGSPAYGLWAQATCSFKVEDAAQVARESLAWTSTVPDVAMMLSAVLAGPDGAVPGRTMKALLAQQLADGSWPCSPCLLVTNPSVLTATSPAEGELYASRRRLFSTAHAVAALARSVHLPRAARLD